MIHYNQGGQTAAREPHANRFKLDYQGAWPPLHYNIITLHI